MKRLVLALMAAVLMVAACGNDNDSEAASEAAHNDADVAFARSMVPHHEQAVDMAGLAADRAEADAVKDLAARIGEAQSPEIDLMQGWLEAWGEEVDGGGMMSDAEMAEIEAAVGEEFDRLFLEQMRGHHEGAVQMARTELSDGQFPPAKELARMIVDTQQAEIDEMDRVIADL